MNEGPHNAFFYFSLRKWTTSFLALACVFTLKAQNPQDVDIQLRDNNAPQTPQGQANQTPQTNQTTQTIQSPSGQSNPNNLEYAVIHNIYVEGNKRTKTDVILRELDFGLHDTLPLSGLPSRLAENELNILNTGLFTNAKITYKEWTGATNEVGLLITVQEGWYIFPFPILEMADRNFNVWWDTYNHSLRRLNYGVRFYHTNLTGHKDHLKAVFQLGFTRKYELVYTLPYINRSKTLGLNVNFLHTREKEIGYTTAGNELLFSRSDGDPLLRRFRLGAGLTLRRKLDTRHRFNLTFFDNFIDKKVRSELNPHFFINGLQQRYLSASYQYELDKRDIRPYPMHGHYVQGTIERKGLGYTKDFDALNLDATWAQFFSFGKKWSMGYVLRGKTNLQRERQPYYGSQALGYEPDFIRGYEYYVTDGLDFAFNKTLVRYRLFDRKLNLGPYIRLESFKEMPVKLFIVLHNELGYVNNPFYAEGNSLANELLWGTTLGVDLVLYYDKVVNFEVSRNRLNEYGFYLHWTFSF